MGMVKIHQFERFVTNLKLSTNWRSFSLFRLIFFLISKIIQMLLSKLKLTSMHEHLIKQTKSENRCKPLCNLLCSLVLCLMYCTANNRTHFSSSCRRQNAALSGSVQSRRSLETKLSRSRYYTLKSIEKLLFTMLFSFVE